jgi:hypothetical protein
MEDPHLSPRCENILINKGLVEKRKGYQPLGAVLPDPVVAVFEFETAAAVKKLIAITTKKEYVYDQTGGVWTNITYQNGGNDVDRTGDETATIDYTVLTGVDGGGAFARWILFTNGVDQPRYWDGVAGKFALYNPDLAGFVTCGCVAQFYGHVFLGDITVADHERQTVAWSDTGKLLDFTGPNSGVAILTEAQGTLVRMLPLGDRLVAYSENAINLIAYVGGDIIFSFESSLQETRLVSGRAIVNIGPYHIYMSQEDIELYDGSRLHQSIGGRIYREYRQDLFVELKSRAFAFHDAAKKTIWFNVPISDTTSRYYVLEYDLSDITKSTWVRYEFRDRPVSMGFFSRDSTLFWNSAAIAGLSWRSVELTWDQASTRKGFPTRVFGAANRVFTSDDVIPNDNGSIIPSFWDSIDFTVPQGFESELGRWIELELELKGVECDISISLDEGQTYQLLDTLALNSQWKKYSVFCDEVSSHLRIRVENNCPNSSFQLRWLRAWATPAGPNG